MGWKSILYFEIITTIALFIGLAAINISRAGIGIHLPADAAQEAMKIPVKQSFNDVILHIFPENIAKSVAEGNILQVVVFSLLFGIALAMIKEKYRRPMIVFAEALSKSCSNSHGLSCTLHRLLYLPHSPIRSVIWVWES